MRAGPVLWSISMPGMLPGSALIVELDTQTSVARVSLLHPELDAGFAKFQTAFPLPIVVMLEHDNLVKLVRVLMGWPVAHASITSIAESA